MFYSNILVQSITIFKIYYKLYFISIYRILSYNFIFLSEIVKLLISGNVQNVNYFCFIQSKLKCIFLKMPGFAWANFLICSMKVLYQSKKCKIEVGKVGQNFSGPVKFFIWKFHWIKSCFCALFWSKTLKNQNFKIKSKITIYKVSSVKISDFYVHSLLFKNLI